ncbi:hypothetical protein ACIQ7Q_32025 [Streptomyces sp. NPDC096176]|uniref:hypothetical protein n=1 Tax=Streptomyces sp. NPDC096176 TaxID=3366079 RepID=UPI00380A7201
MEGPFQSNLKRPLDRARADCGTSLLDRVPDCGLKTRGWPETREALDNLVAVARDVRAGLGTSAS